LPGYAYAGKVMGGYQRHDDLRIEDGRIIQALQVLTKL
jgi:hypothetical protein